MIEAVTRDADQSHVERRERPQLYAYNLRHLDLGNGCIQTNTVVGNIIHAWSPGDALERIQQERRAELYCYDCPDKLDEQMNIIGERLEGKGNKNLRVSYREILKRSRTKIARQRKPTQAYELGPESIQLVAMTEVPSEEG